MKTFNDEVVAMRVIFKALDKLPSYESRLRVMKYVVEAEDDKMNPKMLESTKGACACLAKEKASEVSESC